MPRKELILVVAIALLAGIGIGLYLDKDAALKNAQSEDVVQKAVERTEPQTSRDQTATEQEESGRSKRRRPRHRVISESEGTEPEEESNEANNGLGFTPDFGALLRNWLAEDGETPARKPPNKEEVLREVDKAVDKFRNGTEKERNEIMAGAAVLQVIMGGIVQDLKKNPPEMSIAKRQEILDGTAEAEEIFEALEEEMTEFNDEEKRVFGNTVRVMRNFSKALKDAAEK